MPSVAKKKREQVRQMLELGKAPKEIGRLLRLHERTVRDIEGEFGLKSKKSATGSTDRQRRAAGKRRINPLVIEGVTCEGMRTIEFSDFGRLDVDRTYQRGLKPLMINSLIHVLQSGSIIPDPISLAIRNYEKDGKYWIVDGQQRFMAYMEAEKTFDAMVYRTASLDSERQLFTALNTHIRVNADAQVHAHAGLTAELVRMVNIDPNHSLYDRVAFGQRSVTKPYGAAMLVRGMVSCMTGTDSNQPIDKILMKGDGLLEKRGMMSKQRSLNFLRLIPLVWPGPDRTKAVLVQALGKVASERWTHGLQMPDHKIVTKFRRVNWEKKFPTYAAKYQPIAEKEFREKWLFSATKRKRAS